jgi:hypothetical protein
MMKKRPALFILIPIGIAIFLAIGGWVVSWLWNALLPSLFGLPAVTFWQALGLLALSRILFGGFGGGPGGRHAHKHRHHGGLHGHFTAEERERIRRHLGMSPSGGEEPADSGAET